MIDRFALPILHRIDPELSHKIAIAVLRSGMIGGKGPITSPALQTSIAGLNLPNPVGLAAGFDKNATVLPNLADIGFGFIEAGAATPLAQPGNPKPRMFRFRKEQAVINRFGFNNDGAALIASRLANRPKGRVIGLNLGANKETEDRAKDYAFVLNECGPHCDFVTVNISSPNTAGLRDLQAKEALANLLAVVLEKRNEANLTIPIFLKIAPDLTPQDLDDICEIGQIAKIDAIIATNTTLARIGISGADADQAGGLSGRPLFYPSTRILAALYDRLQGAIPIIGVGGISSAQDAYDKIKAGANVIQLYSALAFQGFGLVKEICDGLETLLAQDGYDNIAQAVGTDYQRWLD